MSTKRRGANKSNKAGIFGISVVVILLAFFLYTQIDSRGTDLEKLRQQEATLQSKYDDEISRAKELEEKRIYVKTKRYVEEVAKQLGLVYPDEIIYKPKN